MTKKGASPVDFSARSLTSAPPTTSVDGLVFVYIARPRHDNLRLSRSSQVMTLMASSNPRQRSSPHLRVDSLSTLPPMPPCFRKRNKRP
ncbi:hypothetical protein PoB_001075600 [Plakobranchus ocellatus]|uniref:Uncharacterized protein n=1 Tax=Plakobranchus ocellatus TaxID=259542 RepID=A0AAV3YPB4_9GAST|nr:hypothetical protein PoB_001075600 [Plakobranchus ocellatus]